MRRKSSHVPTIWVDFSSGTEEIVPQVQKDDAAAARKGVGPLIPPLSEAQRPLRQQVWASSSPTRPMQMNSRPSARSAPKYRATGSIKGIQLTPGRGGQCGSIRPARAGRAWGLTRGARELAEDHAARCRRRAILAPRLACPLKPPCLEVEVAPVGPPPPDRRRRPVRPAQAPGRHTAAGRMGRTGSTRRSSKPIFRSCG